MTAQFLKMLDTKNNNTICLLKAPASNGRAAWWFVRVQPPKLKAFKQHACSQAIRIPDYGTILESGFGEEPPTYILERIKQTYHLSDGAFAA